MKRGDEVVQSPEYFLRNGSHRDEPVALTSHPADTCPHCGYSAAGLTVAVCPECGGDWAKDAADALATWRGDLVAWCWAAAAVYATIRAAVTGLSGTASQLWFVVPYAAIAAVAWGGFATMRRQREQIGRRPYAARLAAALTAAIFILPAQGVFAWFVVPPVCIMALIAVCGPIMRHAPQARWLDGPTKPRR